MKSCFDRIARAVRAKDIKSKIGRVFARDDMFDGLVKEGKFFNELPNIVVHNGTPVSWFLGSENLGEDSSPSPGKKVGFNNIFDDLRRRLPDPLPVSQLKLHVIHKDDIIATSTTFLQCVTLLVGKPERLLVVVNRGKPIGSVQFRNLFDPIGRLCLLQLVLDLEVAAIELLNVQDPKLTATLLKEEFDRDNEKEPGKGRKESGFARARDRFFNRNPQYKSAWNGFDDLIRISQVVRLLNASLSFSRRRDIIKKHKLLLRPSNTQLIKIFERAEFLRNCCAHPTGFEDERFMWTPPPEFDKATFPKLYHDIRSLTSEMCDQVERERRITDKSL